MDGNELGNKSWLLSQPMKSDDDDDDDDDIVNIKMFLVFV